MPLALEQSITAANSTWRHAEDDLWELLCNTLEQFALLELGVQLK